MHRSAAVAGLSIALLGGLGPASAHAVSPSPSPSSSASTSPSPSSSPSASPSPSPQPSTSVSYARKATEFSLSISPTRLVVSAADIDRVQQFKAVNRGDEPLAVTVEKRNFIPQRDGSLAYAKTAPYGAESWLKLSPTHFVVQPGEAQIITATIVQPSDVDSGDHQAAIVFLVPSGRTAGNIKVNRGIATPVYVTVPGPIDDTVTLTHFSAPGFTAGGSVPLSLTVQNQGTVHRDFRGATAIVVHAAGKPTSFPDFTVPRGATRDVSTTWEPPLLCICHPSVSFPNTDGAPQTATIRVVVFPWPLALGVLAAVLVVLLLLRLRRRRAVPAAVPARASSVGSSGDA